MIPPFSLSDMHFNVATTLPDRLTRISLLTEQTPHRKLSSSRSLGLSATSHCQQQRFLHVYLFILLLSLHLIVPPWCLRTALLLLTRTHSRRHKRRRTSQYTRILPNFPIKSEREKCLPTSFDERLRKGTSFSILPKQFCWPHAQKTKSMKSIKVSKFVSLHFLPSTETNP